MIFQFEDYTIEVYEEKMQTLANRDYRCECPICRAFRKYANTFSNDVKKHFDALGLELEDPDEVYDLGKDENGNTVYSVWWNLFGEIIKDSQKPYCIADDFEIIFCEDMLYTPKWFQNSPCIQMRAVIRGSNFERLGKEYWKDTDVFGVCRNTFRYHIDNEVCSALKDLAGCELIGMNDGMTKCRNVNLYIKRPDESELRVFLTADRDTDTCFDGIDRMVFGVNISNAEKEFAVDKISTCRYGTIQKIKIYESTIAGERDQVIYDSHLLIELEGGKKIIIRIEPDGEEVLTVFTDVEDCDIEKYLRVSDIWFVHSAPILDDKNEIVGWKSFYRTETKVRV